jgi:hypothetical protein
MPDPQVQLTNGVGSAEHIDLATTKVVPAPPTGEIGSAYDRDRIFTRFDDGKYFETRDLWARNFEEMLRLDGKARTLEQVLTLPLMSAEHSIEPAKGDSGEAEFVIDALTRPANAGGMTTPLELVIPPQKSFVYLHNQHRDPLSGTSDLETAWHIFESKQKIRFLWYSFLENQAMQKMIFHHSNNDPNDLTAQANRAATLKGGGVLAVGPDQSADAYPGGDGAEFKNAIAYLDGEMAGSVLAAFTELPSAAQLGRGSYALAESATDFFLQSRMATLTEMGESLTSWVIADLIRYNFGDGAAVPQFRFKPPAQDSTEKAIEMLQSLATAQAPTAVPHEFIDLLTEKVAGYFNIDVSQVHDAIQKQQEAAPKTPTGQLMAGVNAATRLAQQAGFASGSQPAAPAAAA